MWLCDSGPMLARANHSLCNTKEEQMRPVEPTLLQILMGATENHHTLESRISLVSTPAPRLSGSIPHTPDTHCVPYCHSPVTKSPTQLERCQGLLWVKFPDIQSVVLWLHLSRHIVSKTLHGWEGAREEAANLKAGKRQRERKTKKLRPSGTF